MVTSFTPALAILSFLSVLGFLFFDAKQNENNKQTNQLFALKNFRIETQNKNRHIEIQGEHAHLDAKNKSHLHFSDPLSLTLSGNQYPLKALEYDLSTAQFKILGIGSKSEELNIQKTIIEPGHNGISLEGFHWKGNYPLHNTHTNDVQIQTIIASIKSIHALPFLLQSIKDYTSKKSKSQTSILAQTPEAIHNPMEVQCTSLKILKSRFYIRCSFKHLHLKLKHLSITADEAYLSTKPLGIVFKKNIDLVHQNKKTSPEQVFLHIQNAYLKTNQGIYISLLP